MQPDIYQRRWAELKSEPHAERLRHLGRQVAMSFLDQYYFNDYYEAEYIDLLCDMATAFDDGELNRAATSALFGMVVEGLCDDFEELQTEAYNRVISQVIARYIECDNGAALRERLERFGLYGFHDLYERIENIRRTRDDAAVRLAEPLRKVVVLSRVTLGADVAICSIIVQRFQQRFPQAQIVLIGDSKLEEIFGGNTDVTIHQVHYERRGTLADRFDTWLNVADAVHSEVNGYELDQVLLVDPDSRLSQLGVLPLIHDSRYLFFNSRGDRAHPGKMSFGELTNRWLNVVLSEDRFVYPAVWLKTEPDRQAAAFCDRLRQAGCGTLTAINIGVGGNERKRLSSEFEAKLVCQLLTEPNTSVILDRGIGGDERARTDAIIQAVRSAGFAVNETEFCALPELAGQANALYAVTTRIGEIAALIAHSEEYIGYDSACQHIAAALGVHTYTLFAGSNNTRFVRRWCASGTGITRLIHVDTLSHPDMFTSDDIVSRVLSARAAEQ